MADAAQGGLRYVVPQEVAGRVHVGALRAAKYLSQLILCIEHYDRLGEQMLTNAGKAIPAGVAEARIRQRAIFDQLEAAREDILRLAADAKANGNDVLRTSRFAGMDPKPDTSLKAPDPSDQTRVLLTLHVIQTALKRETEGCVKALRDLVRNVSVAPDPGALVLASQLDDLATTLDAST